MQTDADILENAPTMIDIAGGSYPFPEPGKRRARGLLAMIMKICEDFPALATTADKGGDEGADPANPKTFEDMVADGSLGEMREGLVAVDAMLDVMYAAIPAMGKNRDHIDAKADEAEISNAFTAVAEVIQRPFGSSGETVKTPK
jgi:hypothetical protein